MQLCKRLWAWFLLISVLLCVLNFPLPLIHQLQRGNNLFHAPDHIYPHIYVHVHYMYALIDAPVQLLGTDYTAG